MRARISPQILCAHITDAARHGPNARTVSTSNSYDTDGSHVHNALSSDWWCNNMVTAVQSPRARCSEEGTEGTQKRITQGMIEFTHSPPPPVLLGLSGAMFLDWEANSERQDYEDVSALLGNDLQVCL